MRLRRTGESVGIEGLEEVIVRVTTAVALGFLALLLVAGTITGDSRFFMQAINPAAPGLVGIVMLVSGNVRALLQLAAGGGAIALTTGVLDVGSRSGALLGLVSMAIVGALLVRRQVVAFIVGTPGAGAIENV